MSPHARPGPTNSRQTLAAAMGSLRRQGFACDVFGGWAEEILGLREPGPHGDIDLAFRGADLSVFDTIGYDFTPVPAKRFAHKRAFLFRQVLCEIILVRDAGCHPVTHYWGDVPFFWRKPLLHPVPVGIESETATVISAENLHHHRLRHHLTQPHRWRDLASRIP